MIASTPSTLEHKGCALAFTIRGEGPPVVLIQGAGMHGQGWKPQVDHLANCYACLSFDNRGVGASQPYGAGITIEQMAEDTCKLMDAQNWASAHLVGHSMGGLVALHIALTAPQRARSLSLLCTFSRGGDAAQLTWDKFWLGLRTYVGTPSMRRRAFLKMVMPDPILAVEDKAKLAKSLAVLFGHDLAHQPPVVMKQLSAMRGYDATAKLGQLAGTRTLVVGAKHDRIAKVEITRALARRIPGARYIEFAEAAHGVTIQCAEQINALLEEHFQEADSSKNLPA